MNAAAVIPSVPGLTPAATAAKRRATVLCVDDEPNVLEGLALHLRRRYEVLTATSGEAALELLDTAPQIAVVVSDMRMPNMDGADFLSRVRHRLPDASRVLLTGQADLDSAISAVNDGQIFRFLTKPCPPPLLLIAIEAAVEQHRLLTAERELLEQTLHGCIKALTDVLSLTAPAAFGRAMRIKEHATELAEQIGLKDRWQLEVAAMLSQLGAIIFPEETSEKLLRGEALTEAEQQMVARAPSMADSLLAAIPRLEGVREIMSSAVKSVIPPWPNETSEKAVREQSAHVLRVAIDFDVLEARGDSSAFAVDTLRGRAGRYAAPVLEALVKVRASGTPRDEVREVPVSGLRLGMIITEEVRTTTGALLVGRGYEVTSSFLERVRNFAPGAVKEPLRVITRPSKENRS